MTLVLFVVGGLLFVRSFRSGQVDSLDRGLVAYADALARQLRDPAEELDLGGSGPTSPVATGEIVAQVLAATARSPTRRGKPGARSVLDALVLERARRRRTFTEIELDRDREPFRVLAQPQTIDGRDRVLVVGTSLEETNEAVGRVQNGLIIGGAAAVALAAIGGWVLATAALRPVEHMRRRAASISAHDPTARLPVPATRDEVASLAETMNELLGRLQGALQRQREFVADAGHELRTPLAILQTELELAQRGGRTPEELQEAIAHAAIETDRLARMADELLFLARGDSDRLTARREPVDLDALFASVLRGYDATARESDVSLQQDVPAGARGAGRRRPPTARRRQPREQRVALRPEPLHGAAPRRHRG